MNYYDVTYNEKIESLIRQSERLRAVTDFVEKEVSGQYKTVNTETLCALLMIDMYKEEKNNGV